MSTPADAVNRYVFGDEPRTYNRDEFHAATALERAIRPAPRDPGTGTAACQHIGSVRLGALVRISRELRRIADRACEGHKPPWADDAERRGDREALARVHEVAAARKARDDARVAFLRACVLECLRGSWIHARGQAGDPRSPVLTFYRSAAEAVADENRICQL